MKRPRLITVILLAALFVVILGLAYLIGWVRSDRLKQDTKYVTFTASPSPTKASPSPTPTEEVKASPSPVTAQRTVILRQAQKPEKAQARAQEVPSPTPSPALETVQVHILTINSPTPYPDSQYNAVRIARGLNAIFFAGETLDNGTVVPVGKMIVILPVTGPAPGFTNEKRILPCLKQVPCTDCAGGYPTKFITDPSCAWERENYRPQP